MIRLKLGEFDDSDVAYMAETVAACRKSASLGFPYDFYAPGGSYGDGWWSLDFALILSGAKWLDPRSAKTMARNFFAAQCPDGRVKLWAYDDLPGIAAGGDVYAEKVGVSALPKWFDALYGIARRTADEAFLADTLAFFEKNLDWWFSARLDGATGLVTAAFEETFPAYLGHKGEYAPPDTNTEVATGCLYASRLARRLGQIEKAERYASLAKDLQNAVNDRLWNEKTGAYQALNVKTRTFDPFFGAFTFAPLRFAAAPRERRERLKVLLTDDDVFGFASHPLTSVAKTDPAFTVTHGDYRGNASWSGSVWMTHNETAVRGLADCREDALAGLLAYKTLATFRKNAAEFADPFTGEGHGVKRYGWTAALWLSLLVETLFGVKEDAWTGALEASPKMPKALAKEAYLHGLPLADGGFLDVDVRCGEATCTVRTSDTSPVAVRPL